MLNLPSYNTDFPKIIRESGFLFNAKKTNTRIDWNEIRAIDIERVVIDRDFRTIDNHLYEVLNCQLETEFDVRILDNGFVKLFRLAQLSIEYLLQCRKQLDITIVSLNEEVKTTKEEKEYLKRQLNSREDDIRKLQNKSRKRQRHLGQYKYDEISEFLKGIVLTGSSNTTLSVGEQNIAALCKCVHCNKLFMNQFFLQAHVNRRHSNEVLNFNNNASVEDTINDRAEHDSYKAMTEKLHQEINEMRERLSIAEKRHFDEIFNRISNSDKTIEKEEIEPNEKTNLKKLNNADNECNTNTNASKNDVTKEMFEEWKREEQGKYVQEIEILKTQLQESMKRMEENMKESTEKIDKDDNAEKLIKITDALNRQENEVKFLKEKLHNEVISKENDLLSRLDEQEKQWRSKLKILEEQYSHTIHELNSNIIQQVNESHKNQIQYQSKIESLENNLKIQLQTLEVQSNKLESLNEANKTLSELAEKYQNISKNMEKNKNISENLCQETLSPHVNEVHNYDIKNFKLDKKNKQNQSTKTDSTEIIQKITVSNFSSDSSEDGKKQNETAKLKISKKIMSNKELDEKTPINSGSKFKNKNLKVKHKLSTQENKYDTKFTVEKDCIDTSESDSENIPKESPKKHTGKTQSYKETGISIQTILAKKPYLAKAVKKDLQLLVKKRLQNIGIQSKVKGIPSDDFRKAVKYLQHKEQFMSKQYNGYTKHRKNIIKQLDEKLKQLDMSERTSTSSIVEQSKSNSPFKVMGSLLSNVKNKAKNIMKSRENLKTDLEKLESKPYIKQSKQLVKTPTPEKLSAKSILAMLDSKNIKYDPNSNDDDEIKSESKPSESSIESSEISSSEDEYMDQNTDSAKIVTTAISHTPSRSMEKLLNSPVRKPTGAQSIPTFPSQSQSYISETKTTLKENSDAQLQSVGRFSKSGMNSNNLDDSITLSESDRDERLADLKKFPPRKAVSEDDVSTRKTLVSPKGVLKNVASTGSLTKKKVLFDLDANKMKPVESVYSIQEHTTKTITEDDWNIYDELPEEQAPSFKSSNDVINLSTKQSPKIAEITKLVQSQLSHRDIKPPIGSVETMFQIPVVSTTNKQESNTYNLNNKPISTPTGSKNKNDSDIELSDWSIDEIINTN